VSLDAFARRLAVPGPPPAHALPLGIRFADSIGALLTGARTREAQRTRGSIPAARVSRTSRRYCV
jgi:hypothetical protein